MKLFTIDVKNEILVFNSATEAKQKNSHIEKFKSELELSILAQTWSSARLVETWNTLPGVVPVHRFTSRSVAVRRIWRAVQNLEPAAIPPLRGPGLKQAGVDKTASTKQSNRDSRNKTARLITYLQRPDGVTLPQIMRITGWQAHTVRGFISGHLKKKLRLKVRSFKRDGERVYSVIG